MKCILKGVPYIQSKLCQEEDLPPAALLQSATANAPALRLRPHSEAPLTAPLTAPPTAPPPTPPWGVSAPSAPPSGAQEEGAPPPYEEVENYPLVRVAEAAPPPYKYIDNV